MRVQKIPEYRERAEAAGCGQRLLRVAKYSALGLIVVVVLTVTGILGDEGWGLLGAIYGLARQVVLLLIDPFCASVLLAVGAVWVVMRLRARPSGS